MGGAPGRGMPAEVVAGRFDDVMGFDVAEWREGFARIRLEVADVHRNRQGYVHGGVIGALIDGAGLWAGNYDPATGGARGAATVSTACNFIGGAKGGVLLAEGSLVRAGKSMYFATATVLDAATGAVLATGHGAYKYR